MDHKRFVTVFADAKSLEMFYSPFYEFFFKSYLLWIVVSACKWLIKNQRSNSFLRKYINRGEGYDKAAYTSSQSLKYKSI